MSFSFLFFTASEHVMGCLSFFTNSPSGGKYPLESFSAWPRSRSYSQVKSSSQNSGAVHGTISVACSMMVYIVFCRYHRTVSYNCCQHHDLSPNYRRNNPCLHNQYLLHLNAWRNSDNQLLYRHSCMHHTTVDFYCFDHNPKGNCRIHYMLHITLHQHLRPFCHRHGHHWPDVLQSQYQYH